jgi:hypothetical protein
MPTGKPYKGRITEWSLAPFKQTTIVIGLFVDHPQFAGQRGHTSHVVSLDKYGRLETRNSRYLLVSEVVENEQEEAPDLAIPFAADRPVR